MSISSYLTILAVEEISAESESNLYNLRAEVVSQWFKDGIFCVSCISVSYGL